MKKDFSAIEIGTRIGKLTILENLGQIKSEKDKHFYYKTKCDCGNERIVMATLLRKNKIISCQKCSIKENSKKRSIEIGAKYGDITIIENLGKIKNNDEHDYYKIKCKCDTEQVIRDTLIKTGKKTCCYNCAKKLHSSYKHGKTNTRLFNIWQSMKERCNLKTCHAYKDYGGRGIKICDDWENNFINFYNWAMSNGYNDKLTIDRIDVNGNYEPNNCRWANKIVQANNCRSNRLLTLNGETYTMAEWGRKTGIGGYNIENRLNKYGWSIEKALTTPIKNKNV